MGPPAIGEAEALVERALRIGRAGPYQLQAAIVAVHADAPSYDETIGRRWSPFTTGSTPSSQPRSSHSTGRWRWPSCADPEPALAEVEPLAERLAGYHLYHAARGELLRRLGRFEEARGPTRRRCA